MVKRLEQPTFELRKLFIQSEDLAISGSRWSSDSCGMKFSRQRNILEGHSESFFSGCRLLTTTCRLPQSFVRSEDAAVICGVMLYLGVMGFIHRLGNVRCFFLYFRIKSIQEKHTRNKRQRIQIKPK